MQSLKCSMTLPLLQPQQHPQSQFQSASVATPDLLASLGFLSPTGGLSMAASTADLLLTPTSFLNPAFVSEEQKNFVMNFDEKLQSLMSSERVLAETTDQYLLEDPEDDDVDDDDWPADSSDDQLRLVSVRTPASSSSVAASRLERKRRRNRDAARRCRERKLERLRCLDERAGELRKRNSELARLASRLRSELDALRLHGCHCGEWTGLA